MDSELRYPVYRTSMVETGECANLQVELGRLRLLRSGRLVSLRLPAFYIVSSVGLALRNRPYSSGVVR
jgi:hypothetical protein